MISFGIVVNITGDFQEICKIQTLALEKEGAFTVQEKKFTQANIDFIGSTNFAPIYRIQSKVYGLQDFTALIDELFDLTGYPVKLQKYDGVEVSDIYIRGTWITTTTTLPSPWDIIFSNQTNATDFVFSYFVKDSIDQIFPILSGEVVAGGSLNRDFVKVMSGSNKIRIENGNEGGKFSSKVTIKINDEVYLQENLSGFLFYQATVPDGDVEVIIEEIITPLITTTTTLPPAAGNLVFNADDLDFAAGGLSGPEMTEISDSYDLSEKNIEVIYAYFLSNLDTLNEVTLYYVENDTLVKTLFSLQDLVDVNALINEDTFKSWIKAKIDLVSTNVTVYIEENNIITDDADESSSPFTTYCWLKFSNDISAPPTTTTTTTTTEAPSCANPVGMNISADGDITIQWSPVSSPVPEGQKLLIYEIIGLVVNPIESFNVALGPAENSYVFTSSSFIPDTKKWKFILSNICDSKSNSISNGIVGYWGVVGTELLP